MDSLVDSITASIKPKPKFDDVFFDCFEQSRSDYCIYRVPERLRSVKPEAYTPLIVSIGPFHHGHGRLKTMEHFKTQYLHNLLDRHPDISLDIYVRVLLELETRARNCYAETIPYTKEEFVKMLLVDGCFLLELFLQYRFPSPTQDNDQLFTNRWIFNAVHHDVLLLENQIPFCVLETLLQHTPTGLHGIPGLCDLIKTFLGPHKLLGDRHWDICRSEEILLLSVLKSITDVKKGTEETTPTSQTTIAQPHLKILRVCCPFKKKIATSLLPIQKKNATNLTFIPSATELSTVGVKFAESKSSDLLNVRFDGKGVLSIPSLVVDDRAESFLRNLIALEQTSSKTNMVKDHNQSLSNKIRTISAYVTLMDCLVNTSTDVALLRGQGILHNQLGDDDEVAQLFNKLRTGIIMKPDEFWFSEVFKRVNAYYSAKWKWWAWLFREFIKEFWSTPWRKASLLAATFFLLCTFVETVCSFLQVLPHWSN